MGGREGSGDVFEVFVEELDGAEAVGGGGGEFGFEGVVGGAAEGHGGDGGDVLGRGGSRWSHGDWLVRGCR